MSFARLDGANAALMLVFPGSGNDCARFRGHSLHQIISEEFYFFLAAFFLPPFFFD